VLEPEFSKPYFLELQRFLQEEDMKATIYPPKQKVTDDKKCQTYLDCTCARQIWAAFSACPFEEVRVVIIGQDPYHGDGQAEGLCQDIRIKYEHVI
jgi:uracil-DNA glycosylase